MAQPLLPSHEVTHHLGRGLGFCWRAFLALAAAAWAWWIRSVGKRAAELRKEGGFALRDRALSPCTVAILSGCQGSRVGPGQSRQGPGLAGTHQTPLLSPRS